MVENSDHTKKMSDEELTETIYTILEGSIVIALFSKEPTKYNLQKESLKNSSEILQALS